MLGSRKLMVAAGLFLIALQAIGWTKNYELFSPNQRIKLMMDVGAEIRFGVFYDGNRLITPSVISLHLSGDIHLGPNAAVKNSSRRTVNEKIYPVVKEKSAVINDHFNELTLDFKTPFSLICRAYDDGIAYRFVTRYDHPITVTDEQASFQFARDPLIFFPEEESFMTHQERVYKYIPLSEITEERKSSIPVLLVMNNGPRVLITESDLKDYPGLYLTGKKETPMMLQGIFPHYALKQERKNDRDIRVTEYADYLAKTEGNRTFPWRVLIITETDGELVESQLVYQLARPLQIKDTSWIKPGKVAWDWWNANNLYGVDFQTGINTATYKYYIDFAAQYHIEYVILDEGWYQLGDLLTVNPDMDIEALVRYGNQKNVGIILWVVWKTLEDQLDTALAQFERWGIKGIKVDFMQRDDQEIVNYYWKIAEQAAKRKLLVDFHGAHKPTGMRRAYPNVITREGVLGLEHNKWGVDASPENALILPFTRMVAGPMDYTPGAMMNATREDFRAIFKRPMSQGTRCHQLAMYVVFSSPLQMLADSPSNYLREPECMEFLARVPTVWDETRVLDARVSDYIVIARRSGDEWYLGAMTDWSARDVQVKCSFLEASEYQMDSFQDGINAHRCAIDYRRTQRKLSREDPIAIHLAPGGGWVARIDPIRAF